jgi:hypothetical protein
MGMTLGGGIPATLWNAPLFSTMEEQYRLDQTDGTILWIGVDVEAVDALVNGGSCIESTVRRRLEEMLENEEISISKEYTVTASITVTCGVQETIEARSEGHAADLMHDRIGEGEVDGLFDDHTIDDIDVTDVEVY